MQDKKNIKYFIGSIYDVYLEDAIRYLCGLYSICEKYYTNHGKMHLLLIIYKLWCMKNNEDIWGFFEINLDENKKLSLKNYELCNIYCPNYFDKFDLDDINKRIDDDLSNVTKIPNGFKIKNEDEFSNEAKDLLTEIFREFGGYDTKIINNMLVEISTHFLKYYPSENEQSIYDNLNLFLQNKDAIKNLESNKIIEFINNYYYFLDKDNKFKFNFDMVLNEFEKKFKRMSYLEQKELLETIGIIEKQEKNIEFNNVEKDNHTIKNKLIKRLKIYRGNNE